MKEAFQQEIPVEIAFQSHSLVDLAKLLSSGLSQPRSDADLFLEDFKTPLVLEDVAKLQPKHENLEEISVFVSGATGFLGAFLIPEILNKFPKSRVYCLVRCKDELHGLERLTKVVEFYGIKQQIDFNRLSIVCGNLEEPRFGLSPEKFDDLASNVHLIFHSGCLVNWIRPYSEQRKPNGMF
jgi:hypothetical protein